MRFVGIDLGRELVRGETAVCKFHHLLERHGLGTKIFGRMKVYLEHHGMKIGAGTIGDATILAAPSPTKNKSGERDLDMHQTRKGNEWHLGIHPILHARSGPRHEAHMGVDAVRPRRRGRAL